MALLFGLLWPLQLINRLILRVGRGLAIVALAIMVMVILLQIFMRYALNNALPWPEEAARFLMLWMTGLIAPSAYRRGGFVAIDMFERAIAPRAAAVLVLILSLIALMVLVVGIKIGYRHVGSGWLFASSSLKLPLSLIGGTTVKIKLAWMYMSLWIGILLLTLVNIELILRSLIGLLGGAAQLPTLDDGPMALAD